ncbi:voltage-gated potassium channel [Microbacterium halimionae]|uniref:Voltage-gated potassium channel n=1 Tax=Microbacterium halimionae TaxID=1526413 RepID=A0A7W3JQD2_9MICO|nr:potassium channel family protein [Microbacterium halimionae]MBA8816963.1 voltage-gated potassium channel [Microbacterium halimionae]NII94498.1 voltage-gated potassium channel [Microbacterium halimionae]
MSRNQKAMTRWESVTRWPLTAAALVFLVVYTAQVTLEYTGTARLIASTLIFATWVAFFVDYIVRLSLADPKGEWFRKHLFDLAAVLLPMLRPVRLLSVFVRPQGAKESAGANLRARMLIYGIGAALLLVWIAALSVLEVERYAAGGNIRSFGDAIWWAFCTVTTVGYGDFVPVTLPGRAIAIGLMLGGVVLVGLITATFSSWVIDRVTRGHQEQRAATRADVERLTAELDARLPRPSGNNGLPNVGGQL